MTAIGFTDDRLAQATQLQLTWWRFRRHRLAVISPVIAAPRRNARIAFSLS